MTNIFIGENDLMKKVAIIEDDPCAAEKLCSFLTRYGEENGENFVICRFDNAESFLENYAADYNIVFMDIELPDMDGMKASYRLRELDPDVVLIFVTNMAQYAVGGYSVDAFDFIVKPVVYANFALKIGRALSRMEGKKDLVFWINGKTGARRIAASKLKYIEVSSHVLVYHTTDGEIRSSGTLKAVEEQAGSMFARCNSCYLVNLGYVTGVDGYRVFVGGDVLQISHPKKAEFIRALNCYLNGRT